MHCHSRTNHKSCTHIMNVQLYVLVKKKDDNNTKAYFVHFRYHLSHRGIYIPIATSGPSEQSICVQNEVYMNRMF